MIEDARVTDIRTVHQGHFIESRLITWEDANGVTRKWEAADRVGNVGAVLIIPRLVRADMVIIIRQFRPPAGRCVYEFPAGLIDSGETAEAAAVRELREETGYTAARLRVFPPGYTTPGLSNENVNLVLADVDEDDPVNQNPTTHFDPSENIDLTLVPRVGLFDFYNEGIRAGHAFDAKLAAYILSAAPDR